MRPTSTTAQSNSFSPSSTLDKPLSTSKTNQLQIFLGGSCNPTTWRQNVAIPFLETNGITYYNPQVEDWTPEVVTIERQAKQLAETLLFVIDKQTRSTVSLIESAFLAGDNRNLVLVVYPFDSNVVSLSGTSTQVSNIFESKTTTSRCENKSISTSSSTSKTASFVKSSCSTNSTSRITAKSSIVDGEPVNSTSSVTSSKTTTLSTAKTTSKTTSNSLEVDSKSHEAVREEAIETMSNIKINGELISAVEFRELKEARFILRKLVEQQKIPIFTDILQALNHVSNSLNGQPDRQSSAATAPRNDSNFVDWGSPTSDQLTQSVLVDKSQDSRVNEQLRDNDDCNIRDIYLSLDCDDRTCLESTVIPILNESGLTYNCMCIKDMTSQSSIHDGNNKGGDKLSIDHGGSAYQGSELSTSSSFHQVTGQGSSQLVSTTDDLNIIAPVLAQAIDRQVCAIQSSRVLLFVITNKCRGLSIMVLASHIMALFRKNVVLCIQYLEEPCSIDGETLSKTAIADYNRGRVYLCDYAVKSQVPVFSTIREAIECCSRKCRFENNKK